MRVLTASVEHVIHAQRPAVSDAAPCRPAPQFAEYLKMHVTNKSSVDPIRGLPRRTRVNWGMRL